VKTWFQRLLSNSTCTATKWVKPEGVANRVFLHAGHLHVVPPAATDPLGEWVRTIFFAFSFFWQTVSSSSSSYHHRTSVVISAHVVSHRIV
jgi:hypothetical protein